MADGNFVPVSSGTLTSLNGSFSGTGTTAAAPGTPIWMFAFDDNRTEGAQQALATSTMDNWRVSIGGNTIIASQVNSYVLGQPEAGGIGVAGVPIPEPVTTATLFACIGLLAHSHRSRAPDAVDNARVRRRA